MPSVISLVEICFYGKTGGRMGLWESKNLNKWPPTHQLCLKITMKAFYKNFSTFFLICLRKLLFFFLLLAHHHLNKALRKCPSAGENRLGYFLFSPHWWPLSFLFISYKPSKSPSLFLSNIENNPDPFQLPSLWEKNTLPSPAPQLAKIWPSQSC